ncbi:MAG TPA: adenine phosphoribosyltransferase [Polyangiaceae bacterium]|jgi:adenine phosphoribosyltransferase|nr:adenine phosphoribosyltransferase [Polyangiaceae bacterium]
MAARKRSKYGSKKPLVPARREPTPRGVAKAEPVRPSVLPKRAALTAAVSGETLKYVRSLVRDVPDFPQAGILFRDITPILADPKAFHITLDSMAERFIGEHVDAIVAVESRGFIFGGALAARLNASFVPVRKPGKLPARTDRVAYSLEYGKGELEMHRDALRSGSRVVIVDDLLATGGTAAASGELVRRQGGNLLAYAFVIELEGLAGRLKLTPTPVISLIQY